MRFGRDPAFLCYPAIPRQYASQHPDVIMSYGALYEIGGDKRDVFSHMETGVNADSDESREWPVLATTESSHLDAANTSLSSFRRLWPKATLAGCVLN